MALKGRRKEENTVHIIDWIPIFIIMEIRCFKIIVKIKVLYQYHIVYDNMLMKPNWREAFSNAFFHKPNDCCFRKK